MCIKDVGSVIPLQIYLNYKNYSVSIHFRRVGKISEKEYQLRHIFLSVWKNYNIIIITINYIFNTLKSKPEDCFK